jgi:hypothetical protein
MLVSDSLCIRVQRLKFRLQLAWLPNTQVIWENYNCTNKVQVPASVPSYELGPPTPCPASTEPKGGTHLSAGGGGPNSATGIKASHSVYSVIAPTKCPQIKVEITECLVKIRIALFPMRLVTKNCTYPNILGKFVAKHCLHFCQLIGLIVSKI